jgi:3-methyladenine DNA glycosylase/8-oxoguanine DNA glycosylase
MHEQQKTAPVSLVAQLALHPRPPADFRLTLWKPSHFPTRLEIHAALVSWRTFVVDGLPCGVRMVPTADGWQATVFAADAWSERHTHILTHRLTTGYGLGDDLTRFHARFEEDPVLASSLRALRGMRSSCPESTFELLILAVLLQNTTMRRSRDMLDAILNLAGGQLLFDGVCLSHFCTPQALLALGQGPLRELARVGYRDKTLLAIAEFFANRPDDASPDSPEALLNELCGIRGVGPYTAGVAAASAFRDSRAYGLDVWNRRILARALGAEEEVSPPDLRRMIQDRFAPFEGLAVECLVEHEYLAKPVCPVYNTEKDARQASFLWPRPENG